MSGLLIPSALVSVSVVEPIEKLQRKNLGTPPDALASNVQSSLPLSSTSVHFESPRAAPVIVKRATGGKIVTRRVELIAVTPRWSAVICTSVEDEIVWASTWKVPV